MTRLKDYQMREDQLRAVVSHEAFDNGSSSDGFRVVRRRLETSRDPPMGVREMHRSRRSTLPARQNLLPEEGRSKCSSQSTRRGPRVRSIGLLTQVLTFGLACASIPAFGRCNRMVIVFDVTHHLHHATSEEATPSILPAAGQVRGASSPGGGRPAPPGFARRQSLWAPVATVASSARATSSAGSRFGSASCC